MADTFAHISDPHLSTLDAVSMGDLSGKRLLGYLSWRQRRRFEHRAEVLSALHRDLKRTEPGLLLVTGDLTHIGLPAEFRQARAWLADLGAPERVALVAGNHDACVREEWGRSFGQWQAYLAGDEPLEPPLPRKLEARFPSLRRRGDISFIGLNTARPTPPFMASGTLGRTQLERLPALLDRAREEGRFRVLFLHHCPVPGGEKWRRRLTDADAVQAIVREHGAELVLHGHGHRAQRAVLESSQGPVPVYAVPSASAMGLHGGDPAAYAVHRVSGAAGKWLLESETRRFDTDGGEFRAAEKRRLEIRRPWPPLPESPSPASDRQSSPRR